MKEAAREVREWLRRNGIVPHGEIGSGQRTNLRLQSPYL